jgi:energy-coupling factor transport system permease protein
MEGTQTLKSLHPLAWWGWAIGIGVAVNGTNNPLLLTLMALAMIVVVLARRSRAPWARSVRAYLMLAAFVIGMRVLFQVLIGAKGGQTVLLVLPELPLPVWAAGVRLGGTLTAEALASTGYDALRLAVMLACIGAANALASPRQALRSVPGALYEVSVAVVVALNVAPQLIESGQRVQRARRLRGNTARGLRALGPIALSVLADAIDRSLSLAAGMEARGFARTSKTPARGALLIMVSSSVLATFGGFLLLSTDLRLVAATLLIAGLVGAGWGLRRAGARLGVTRYRPHPWGWPETSVVAAGALAAVVVLGVGALDADALGPALAAFLEPQAFFPSTDPLIWPQLSIPMLAVVGLVLIPLPLTAPPRSRIPDAARCDVRTRSPRPAPELVA